MMFITYIIVLHTENIISNDSNGNNNNNSNSNNIPSAQVRTKVFNFSTEPNCIVAIPIHLYRARCAGSPLTNQYQIYNNAIHDANNIILCMYCSIAVVIIIP